MDSRQRKRLSKYLSLVLRHRPEAAGVALDARGCCPIDELAAAATRALRFPVDRAAIEELARPAPGEKIRFEVEGDLVRAGHGHSLPVNGYRRVEVSATLYHATVRAALPAIRRDGLRAMQRQKVHLSYDRAITLEAARRRAPDTVLIEVDLHAAAAAGVCFYESADPRIVLADDIPAACLHILD
jgi:putative RNA 2'-phosphotransferase